MLDGIPMSAMSPAMPAESLRRDGPVDSGSSTGSSVTVLKASTADTGLFRSNDVVSAKGVLARFKAFILRPGQAVIRWVHQLLHGPAPKAAEVSVVLTPGEYAERLPELKALLRGLERIVLYDRTTIANAAKGVLKAQYEGVSAHDWARGVANAKLIVARVAQSSVEKVAERVGSSIAHCIDESISYRTAGSVSDITVDEIEKDFSKNLEESVAKALEVSVEKDVAQRVAKIFAQNHAMAVAQNVPTGVVKSAAMAVAQTVVKDSDAGVLFADHLNQITKAAYGVIQKRNVEASTPLPTPTDEELVHIETWLGPENSLKRLDKLWVGLFGVRVKEGDASALLAENIQGFSIEVWGEGGPLINDWFKNASPMVKREVAVELNDWAVQATALLFAEAEELQVKARSQAASNRLQYV